MERWCCATETSERRLSAGFCGVSSAVFGYGFAALLAAAAMRASLAQITRVQASCCAELSVAVAQAGVFPSVLQDASKRRAHAKGG